MQRITVTFACVCLMASLLSCAKPPVTVNRVLVHNASDSTIKAVSIRHQPTDRFAEVNAILPQNMLEIGLSAGGRPVLARQALVSWQDGAGRAWSVSLAIPDGSTLANRAQPANLVYVIYPDGRATVGFQEAASVPAVR